MYVIENKLLLGRDLITTKPNRFFIESFTLKKRIVKNKVSFHHFFKE